MSERSESKSFNASPQGNLEELIAFVLGHPGMSEWLKVALNSALHRDPVEVLNDLEILNLILRHRSMRIIQEGLGERGK